jgi:hypothetical protein
VRFNDGMAESEVPCQFPQGLAFAENGVSLLHPSWFHFIRGTMKIKE